MPYSKFWLLTFFIIFLTLNSFADDKVDFSSETFLQKYKSLNFNISTTVNNLKYVESIESYEHYFAQSVIENSIECFKEHKDSFLTAAKKFGVSHNIILAILTVETNCGSYQPKHSIMEAYKSLIEVAEDPNKQEEVYKEILKKYPNTEKDWYLKRVEKKSSWAKGQIDALKKIYTDRHLDIFQIKGSWAGAFGLSQFIPTTYINIAVDGDNDSNINLDTFPDAIYSIANYFRLSGWNDNLQDKDKINVIYKYNHSKLYCETILKLSKLFADKTI